jgi:4-amino-4-deoxy-L-arabinose transferase-like glycosyltransferase
MLSLALIILRLIFIGTTMIIDDEAYYTMYARHLSPGYIDHGPIVGIVIWTFTSLFGENGFGVRIGAVLMLSGLGWILYEFGKKYFSKRTGIILSLLVTANILFHTNGIIITPDAPLAFFTIITIITYFKAYHKDPKYLIPGGILLGFALLSKISALFPAIAIALYPILNSRKREFLKDSRYYLSFLFAIIVFSPFIFWNAQNGWAFFAYQGAHVSGKGGWGTFLELWTGLFILVGPVLFFYAITKPFEICLKHKERKKNSDAVFYFSLVGIIPLIYFLVHSFFSRMEVNWPAPVFFGGFFVCGIIFGQNWIQYRKQFYFQIIYSLILIGIITIQTYLPFLPVHGKNDITNRYYYYSSFDDELKLYFKDQLGDREWRIASNNFQVPSMINVYLKPKLEAVCLSINYHETLYSFLYPDSMLVNKDLLLIWKGKQYPGALKDYFQTITKLNSFESKRGGSVLRQYTFWLAAGYKGKIH